MGQACQEEACGTPGVRPRAYGLTLPTEVGGARRWGAGPGAGLQTHSSLLLPGMMLGGGCGQQLAYWIVHGRPEKDMHSYDIRRVPMGAGGWAVAALEWGGGGDGLSLSRVQLL